MKTPNIKAGYRYNNFSVVRLQIELKTCIIYSSYLLMFIYYLFVRDPAALGSIFIYDDLSLILRTVFTTKPIFLPV